MPLLPSAAVKVPAVVALALLLACGGPAPQPVPATGTPAESAEELDTDLPAELPTPFELDLRQRSEDGDDLVLKLTESGARYGVAHGRARVALRYRFEPAALERAYAALRHGGYDRIETQTRARPSGSGSTMRVKAGPVDHSVSAMGRNEPTERWAEAYAASVAAAESLLPRGRSEVVVRLHWDESMAERAAALDMDLGEDFVGIHRLPGPRPDVELHLLRARPLEMLLRAGSPPTSTTLTIEAGRDAGIEIAYDPQRDAVVLRPLARDPSSP